ncbi:MAG: hypothetical protein ACTS6G_01660 [Candidatus Hodgkinia cicadicola]
MSKRKLIAKFTKPMLNDMAATASMFKQINVGRGWKPIRSESPFQFIVAAEVERKSGNDVV